MKMISCLSAGQMSDTLAKSRKAEDDERVQRAAIVRIDAGVAIVERYDWTGKRMLDYPVRLVNR